MSGCACQVERGLPSPDVRGASCSRGGDLARWEQLLVWKPWLRPALELGLGRPLHCDCRPSEPREASDCGGVHVPPSALLRRRRPSGPPRGSRRLPPRIPGWRGPPGLPGPLREGFGGKGERHGGAYAAAPPPGTSPGTIPTITIPGPAPRLDEPARLDWWRQEDGSAGTGSSGGAGDVSDVVGGGCDFELESYWRNTSRSQCIFQTPLPAACRGPTTETLDCSYGAFSGLTVDYRASLAWWVICRYLTQSNEEWLADVRYWGELSAAEQGWFLAAAQEMRGTDDSQIDIAPPEDWVYLGNVAIQVHGERGIDDRFAYPGSLMELVLSIRLMWLGVDALLDPPLAFSWDALGDGRDWYEVFHWRCRYEPFFVRFLPGSEQGAWTFLSSRVVEVFAGSFERDSYGRKIWPIRGQFDVMGQAACCGPWSWEADSTTAGVRKRVREAARWAGNLAHEVGHSVWLEDYARRSGGPHCEGPDARWYVTLDAGGDVRVLPPMGSGLGGVNNVTNNRLRHWQLSWLGNVTEGFLYGNQTGVARELTRWHRVCCLGEDGSYQGNCSDPLCDATFEFDPDEARSALAERLRELERMSKLR